MAGKTGMRAHKLDTVSHSRYTYNTLFELNKVSVVTNCKSCGF